VWVHAVSVGEALASRPLVTAIAQRIPQTRLALSTITPSGYEILSRQFGQGIAVYFPLDLRGCVRRALEAIRPRALLLMEAELWPVVLHESRRRGVPVAVVNGRISERAFRRYALGGQRTRRMLDHVENNAPLRRNVTIEDVGNVAAFLCSDLAAGITGEVVYVDSGYNIIGMGDA